MGLIIGIIVVGILVFVGLSIVLYSKDKKLSKRIEEFIYNYDKDTNGISNSATDVDNINDKKTVNTITTDNNGRKTATIYITKDCKEGITISWDNGKIRRK